MKQCLVDVNVLLSLVLQRHVHHAAAQRWYRGLSDGEGCVCRLVQLGLVRLLSNAAVMGSDVVPTAAAWALSEELLRDARLVFENEPPGLDSVMPSLFRHRTPTKNLVNDVYLAAFAIAGSMRMATRDVGFRQFRGLELQIVE